jgi:hypothetical protein
MKTTHLPESIFKFRHAFSRLSTSMIRFVGGAVRAPHQLNHYVKCLNVCNESICTNLTGFHSPLFFQGCARHFRLGDRSEVTV